MEIKEIYQGVLLASKLLSRISPNMKSPIMSRKSRVNDKSAFEGTEVGTENHLNDNDDDDDENEKSTISHGKVNEVNSMQLCVQQSTQFFNAFVIQWILRNHEQSSMGRTSEETHGMEDEESSSESTLASTFAASCRYLVEVACFPCWQPFLVVKGNDGKCPHIFLYIFLPTFIFVIYLLILWPHLLTNFIDTLEFFQ